MNMVRQQYLFPELDILPKIKRGDCIDVTSIDIEFQGTNTVHKNANRLLSKLKSLDKNKYFLFKGENGGLPYVKNVITGTILKVNTTRNQYPCVAVGIKSVACHRLFAFAFIENPDTVSRVEVDHINEDKMDYRLKNLCWVSSSYNSKKSMRRYIK